MQWLVLYTLIQILMVQSEIVPFCKISNSQKLNLHKPFDSKPLIFPYLNYDSVQYNKNNYFIAQSPSSKNCKGE